MKVDWAEISAAITVGAAVYAGIRRLILATKKSLKNFIASQTFQLSANIKDLSEDQKRLAIQVQANTKTLAELKSLNHVAWLKETIAKTQNSVKLDGDH